MTTQKPRAESVREQNPAIRRWLIGSRVRLRGTNVYGRVRGIEVSGLARMTVEGLTGPEAIRDVPSGDLDMVREDED